MVILGIDPGLATMGYGVINKGRDGRVKMLETGALTTPAKMPLPRRLKLLYDGMSALLERYRPEQVAIEELFFAKNVTTAMTVGQARGVALLAVCQRLDNEIFEYTPMQIKLAVTGYGGADKRQVQQMVKALLNLPAIVKPDDAADALAVAICHAQTLPMAEPFRIH